MGPDQREILKEIMENFDLAVEALKYQAEYKKAYYDELKASGFTDEQALDIVKTMHK